MRNRSMALGMLAAAATWAACSSSTNPSPDALGTWHITVSRMVFVESAITDTLDVRPSPFQLVVLDTGATSSGTFPIIHGLDAEGDTVITWGLGSATGLMASGDSLRIVFDNGTESCLLTLAGTIHGASASGSGGVSCADSTISGGAWSATRS